MLNPNYEAEQTVVGVIMLDSKKAMPMAMLKLNEHDFHVGEFKSIYSACTKLFKAGKAIDAVTVLSIVGEEYKQTIVTSAEKAPTISHLNDYIDTVKSQSQRIEAYNQAMDFITSLEEEKPSITECQSKAAEIAKCFNDNSTQKAITAEEGFLNFLDRQEHPKEHIGSGYSLLDRFVYIDRGDFVVVGGRPSAGKTDFTLQMMLHMAQKHKIGYFSLETSKEKIFDRLISNYTWTSFTKIKTNQLEDTDWDNIAASYDTFHKLGFEIVPAAGWTVEQIKSYSEIAGYEIIFVDYLTLIKGKGKDNVEKTTNISKDLHILAQQNNITVVALSQLSRAGNGDPELTNLRESGQIEQDADTVLLLDYNPEEPYERNLKIAKNKEGQIGKIKFNFDGDHHKFSLVETKYEE